MRRIVILMVLLSALAACSGLHAPLTRQIIGTWKDDISGETQKYTPDGYRFVPLGRRSEPGCWSITGEQLHLLSSIVEGEMLTYKVNIDRDTMQIIVGDYVRRYTRIDSNATLTPEEQELIDTIKGTCPQP